MFRRLCTLVFVLILVATSVSAAVMQSEMQGAQQMLICSDSAASSGLSIITLDATGKPITSAHHCLDCTPAPPAMLPGQTLPAHHSVVTAAPPPPPMPARASTSPPRQSARDPPPFA